MSDTIARLDRMIAALQAALESPREEQRLVLPGRGPWPASYRILADTFSGLAARRPRAAQAVATEKDLLRLNSQADAARNTPVEVSILVEKNRTGEDLRIVTGKVLKTIRISGGYEIQLRIEDVQETHVPASHRLQESIDAGDAAIWNRWCGDLEDGPLLQGQNLAQAPLAGYDLCCADLSGSNLEGANLSGANLSGANLAGCNLDGVRIAGADLFRARLPRRHMALLLASGTVEVESVLLV